MPFSCSSYKDKYSPLQAREAIAKAEKEKEFSEDDRHTEEQDLQKLTDQFIKELDEIGKEKEKELMEI